MNVAIVPAAGLGKRMAAEKNKLFLEVSGKSILTITLESLSRCDIDHVILVIRPEEEIVIREAIRFLSLSFTVDLVHGGKERQDSVYQGLKKIPDHTKMVAIHDGARPFIREEVFQRVLVEAKASGAAIAAVPLKDTVKETLGNPVVHRTLERSLLWAAQTPQIFSAALIHEAYEQAQKESFFGTDDASLVERIGKNVSLVLGDYRNIKLTTPEDLIIGEAFYKEWEE